jgi:hypothetical protein
MRLQSTDYDSPRGSSRRRCGHGERIYIGKLLHYIDFQAQTDPSYNQAVSDLNEAIANVMAKAHARKTRSQDANVTPAPAPAQTVSSAPSAKVVQLEPKAEVQAKAA